MRRVWAMRRGTHLRVMTILFFLFITYFHAEGKKFFYYDRAPYATQEEVRELLRRIMDITDSVVKRDHNTFYRGYILEANDTPYYLINGRNDVFRLDKRYENISESSFHGHNFKSKKFVWRDSLFSYGGYGFWKQHGDLTYFDWDRREWEIKVVPGSFSGVIHWKTFRNDSLLYSFAGKRLVQAKGLEERDNSLHLIDLSDMSYENIGEVKDELLNVPPPHLFFKTDDYHVMLRMGNNSIIIDKSALEFKMSKISFLNELLTQKPLWLYHIKGNEIAMYDSTGVLRGKADIEERYRSMDATAVPLISDPWGAWSLKLLGTALFALLGALLYNWLRKRQEAEFRHPAIEDLIDFDKSVLRVEELDEVFGISDIRQDETKRARRANNIREINMEYRSRKDKELIRRERDPDDKRRFIYRIEP